MTPRWECTGNYHYHCRVRLWGQSWAKKQGAVGGWSWWTSDPTEDNPSHLCPLWGPASPISWPAHLVLRWQVGEPFAIAKLGISFHRGQGGLPFCPSGRSGFLGLVFPVMVSIYSSAGTVPVYCDEFEGWHCPIFSNFVLMVSAFWGVLDTWWCPHVHQGTASSSLS